ncbi:MAG TPA: hypothetical protein VD907_03975 [Verrucomicrobiae bacterium]|nr:hypothetical protein [Verrucomicrobiae bacterium]
MRHCKPNKLRRVKLPLSFAQRQVTPRRGLKKSSLPVLAALAVLVVMAKRKLLRATWQQLSGRMPTKQSERP